MPAFMNFYYGPVNRLAQGISAQPQSDVSFSYSTVICNYREVS